MSLTPIKSADLIRSETRSGSTETVERALAIVREHLEMDVAYLAEFTGGREVYRALAGDAESFGLEKGEGIPLEGTYCKRVAEGLLSNVIPDTKTEPRVSGLVCTTEADIGAYVGIPLVLTDGTVFGSLCCMSHQPNPSLEHKDIGLMRVVASLVSDHIDRDRIEAKNAHLREELVAARALSKSLDARDGYSGEHSEEVVFYAVEVAGTLGMTSEEIAEVSQVALLHDIGKIGIPDSILRKTGTRRGRMGGHEEPHDHRIRARVVDCQRRAHSSLDPVRTRALGRDRISGRSRRPPDPDRQPDRAGLRCLSRDDLEPALPKSDEQERGHRGATSA